MHYALIPAKKHSSRCENKNWRPFSQDKCLVEYLLDLIPSGLFQSIILSTDKRDFSQPQGVVIHYRPKELSTVESSINDLIKNVIYEFNLRDDGYLWLLNPTSPFRSIRDFRKIKLILDKQKPESLVSLSETTPFLWKNNNPMFKTDGARKNTQDFKDKYGFENGQFIVFTIDLFKRHNTWYGLHTIPYLQKDINSMFDIDTPEDFENAQRWAAWKQ